MVTLLPMDQFPDHVELNRRHWDRQAREYVGPGERAWRNEPNWGIWRVPETELGLLPDDMTGMRAIELGCGTAYVSAYMARRGADVVAIDVSEEQLATARRLANEHDVAIEFIHGNAETVPEPDGSFDYAVSEYGAAIWADPYVWIPEAVRLLKPGGLLVFLGNHPLVPLVQPIDEDAPTGWTLINPYFDMHRIEWYDGEDRGVEFHLPWSRWVSLFNDVGLEILEYHELRSPGPGDEINHYASASWAYDYPTEQVWKLRRRQ
jgi:SAM-dependent methyltransferase